MLKEINGERERDIQTKRNRWREWHGEKENEDRKMKKNDGERKLKKEKEEKGEKIKIEYILRE